VSRTVYVVERVVLDIQGPTAFEPDLRPQFDDWTGSNGDHRARVPVRAFADRPAAERHAAELSRGVWATLCPARLIDEDYDLNPDEVTAMRGVLCRHGFDPPEFRRWDDTAGSYRGVPFSGWWADHAHELTADIAAEVGAVVARALYRVEARTLED
jgi:hypothetical protein